MRHSFPYFFSFVRIIFRIFVRNQMSRPLAYGVRFSSKASATAALFSCFFASFIQEEIKKAREFLGEMGLDVQEHIRRVDVNFNPDEIRAYEKVFQKFDLDNTGSITFYNLRRLLNDLGEKVSDEQLRELIAEVDTNRNTTIELDEFLQVSNTGGQPRPQAPSSLGPRPRGPIEGDGRG